jgi:pyruvate ferredoxin oxidoreductase delta subunit
MKDKSWYIIHKSRRERPLLQNYLGHEDLPPIPVSFPQKGGIGRTGDWRTYRPVIDPVKCSKCGFCYLYCPEGVIEFDENTKTYVIDYEYCKGCGICAKQCPKKCITFDREQK